MLCPFCDEQNIDGADTCEHCHQSLSFLSKPRASSQIEYSLQKRRIDQLQPKVPKSVSPETPVGDVLNLLVDSKIGCVIVSEGETMVGIFTERDALMRLNVRAAELADRPISEFMTPSPESIEHDASLAFALHRMDVGGYRHVPVVDAGRVVGIISIRDILRYITEVLMSPGAA